MLRPPVPVPDSPLAAPARRSPHRRLLAVLAPLGLLAVAACSEPATTAAEPVPATAEHQQSPVTTPAGPTTTAAPTTTASATTAPATPVPSSAAPTTTTIAPPAADADAIVANVVDGDTIDVTDGTGATSRVRVIGIDAPEAGSCGGPEATAMMTELVLGKAVTLTMGGDGEDTDRYGRLLRYVDQDGRDAGLTLIEAGRAVARYDSRDGYGRYDREDRYVAADEAAADAGCAPLPAAIPTPAPATPAHYANCAAVRAAGAAPIHPGDPGWQQKFDRDHDGAGCE
jgi:endonuclease YncB( thermonuclease family)